LGVAGARQQRWRRRHHLGEDRSALRGPDRLDEIVAPQVGQVGSETVEDACHGPASPSPRRQRVTTAATAVATVSPPSIPPIIGSGQYREGAFGAPSV